MGRSITVPTGFYFPLRPKCAMDLLLSYGASYVWAASIDLELTFICPLQIQIFAHTALAYM